MKRPSYQKRRLYLAMNTYGADVFDMDELQKFHDISRDELHQWEQAWIRDLEPPLNEKAAHGIDAVKARESSKQTTS